MIPLHQRPLHFSSRIQFMTRPDFNDLPIAKTSSERYLKDGLDTFEKGTHTRGILMCNAGGVVLVTQEKVLLFHFKGDETLPNGRELRQLAEAIQSFKQENPDMRALLIGGESYWPFSIELGEGIKRLFRAEKIPFSVFWGHNTHIGESAITYDVSKDTWYVRTLADDPHAPGNTIEVQNLAQLEQAFEEIHVDPGDEIVLGNRTYRPEDVYKARR